MDSGKPLDQALIFRTWLPLAASWLNMLLHTERATRESVADGGRVFIRYGDLLDDWTKAVMYTGEQLGLQHILHAKSERIRDAHRFVDPGLRRVSGSLDDLGLPKRLHELVADTWTELNKLADEGGDTPEVHEALDQLRETYVDLYAASVKEKAAAGAPPPAPSRPAPQRPDANVPDSRAS